MHDRDARLPFEPSDTDRLAADQEQLEAAIPDPAAQVTALLRNLQAARAKQAAQAHELQTIYRIFGYDYGTVCIEWRLAAFYLQELNLLVHAACGIQSPTPPSHPDLAVATAQGWSADRENHTRRKSHGPT